MLATSPAYERLCKSLQLTAVTSLWSTLLPRTHAADLVWFVSLSIYRPSRCSLCATHNESTQWCIQTESTAIRVDAMTELGAGVSYMLVLELYALGSTPRWSRALSCFVARV